MRGCVLTFANAPSSCGAIRGCFVFYLFLSCHAHRQRKSKADPFFIHFTLSTMLTHAITPPATNQIAVGDDIYNAVFPRSANFRIELDYDAALDFIRQIGDWNDFTPGHVIDALEAADRLIPRCSHDGARSYTISVGREGSPVLYLERSEFSGTERLSDSAMRTICREMELIGQADEAISTVHDFSFSKGRRIDFRFWWD